MILRFPSASRNSSMLARAVLLVFAFVTAGCGQEDSAARIAAMPVEQQLATLDGVSGDELKVARFRALLDQLSSEYHETPTKIGDMTVAANDEIRKKGVDERLLTIMEGMHRIALIAGTHDYADTIAPYIVLRQNGIGHDEAVESLSDIARRLGVGQRR